MFTAKFEKAVRFALKLHKDQLRKGTNIPYLSHLLAVASLVLENGGAETEAIAALLHDGPEDQGGKETLRKIEAKFGKAVAEIVAGCTDAWTDPKPAWRKRKEDYLAHLPQASPSTLLVSAADKLHNARAILIDYREVGETLWNRFNAGKEGTLWYYRALVTTYQKANAPQKLVAELDRVVSEIERLGKAESVKTSGG